MKEDDEEVARQYETLNARAGSGRHPATPSSARARTAVAVVPLPKKDCKAHDKDMTGGKDKWKGTYKCKGEDKGNGKEKGKDHAKGERETI